MSETAKVTYTFDTASTHIGELHIDGKAVARGPEDKLRFVEPYLVSMHVVKKQRDDLLAACKAEDNELLGVTAGLAMIEEALRQWREGDAQKIVQHLLEKVEAMRAAIASVERQ